MRSNLTAHGVVKRISGNDMTHDELLERMNLYTVCDKPTKPGMVCDNEHLRESYPEWFALRAVVERHRESAEHKDIPAGICIECGEKYPCPTIEDITEELG